MFLRFSLLRTLWAFDLSSLAPNAEAIFGHWPGQAIGAREDHKDPGQTTRGPSGAQGARIGHRGLGRPQGPGQVTGGLVRPLWAQGTTGARMVSIAKPGCTYTNRIHRRPVRIHRLLTTGNRDPAATTRGGGEWGSHPLIPRASEDEMPPPNPPLPQDATIGRPLGEKCV